MWWIGAAMGAPVVYEDLHFFDPERGMVHADSLVVDDGRIVHLGDARVEDTTFEHVSLSGKYVVPGWIDAHVHLSMSPGAAFVERTPDEELDRWAHHLRAYVASGVVAVLDTGISQKNAERLVTLEGTRPDVRFAGPLISPPGGYVAAVIDDFEPTPDVATLERQLADFARFEPIGIKVTMEDGMLRPIWPMHDPEIRKALSARDDHLFVHAFEVSETTEALDTLDVHAFVHPPDRFDAALAERLIDTPVVSTLSVFDAMRTPNFPERLTHPSVTRVVPEDELEAQADPKAVRDSGRLILRHIAPKMPGFMRNMVAGLMTADGPIRKRLERVGDGVRQYHEAGVPIVMGSDSGNWPAFLGFFHGSSSLREIELLVESGIPPREVLTMATVNGAELLELEDELGTIEVGKRACFSVLERNPLDDITAIRDILWVVRDGERRTPEGWMR